MQLKDGLWAQQIGDFTYLYKGDCLVSLTRTQEELHNEAERFKNFDCRKILLLTAMMVRE